MSLFVTGTDTGVGKTYAAVRLVRSWAAAGLRVGVMKPVAAGGVCDPARAGLLRNDDALALIAAANIKLPYELVNPYCFALATSPHLAAQAVGIEIETARIVNALREIQARSDVVVVEGAGGWLAPISMSATMQDIALALKLPVVLVVGMRLGCLNHALLTAAAIRACALPLHGWVANRIDRAFADADACERSLREWLPCPQLQIPP